MVDTVKTSKACHPHTHRPGLPACTTHFDIKSLSSVHTKSPIACGKQTLRPKKPVEGGRRVLRACLPASCAGGAPQRTPASSVTSERFCDMVNLVMLSGRVTFEPSAETLDACFTFPCRSRLGLKRGIILSFFTICFWKPEVQTPVLGQDIGLALTHIQTKVSGVALQVAELTAELKRTGFRNVPLFWKKALPLGRTVPALCSSTSGMP